MITISKNEFNTYFIQENGVHIGTCATIRKFREARGKRYMSFPKNDKKTIQEATDFTLKNIKSEKVYELMLYYFPEIRLGQEIKILF